MKKTIINLINTPSNKSMNSFVEKNADKFEFNWVEAPKASMHNCLWASYSWSEDIKTAIAKRIKFKSFHQQTIYRVMFLDLRSGDVHTFKTMDDFTAYDIIRKTQMANYTFDQQAKAIQSETEQWLQLANQLTHGIITEQAWELDRQNCLDKMNLYLTDIDFDSYNAGHLVPTMKKNVHTFDSDYKFFDIQFAKGDVSQHEEEREAEHYEVTELETLKNFCHVLTCKRYGIDFDDSEGNSGRVTRECLQSRVISYTELAELINQSEDRDYYIELLQNGASIEEVASFFDLVIDEVEELSYREF